MRGRTLAAIATGTASVIASVIATAAAPGCYDSRWGEGERTARHNAAYLAPAALSGSPTGSTGASITRVHRVRVVATPRYTTQTLDWKNDFREILDGANAVLGPGFGVKLELEGASLWEGAPPENELADALAALRERDDGAGVTWIVGLVGGLSQFTTSFHQLGLAETPGRRLVLRAATDLNEFDALDKGLAALPASERADVVHARRRHRSVALLLHELAHTLGAVHEAGKESVLSPAYSSSMAGYGDSAAALLRVALPHTDDPPSAGANASLLRDLLADYEKEPGDWDPGERAAMVTHLQSALGVAPPAPAPEAAASVAAPPIAAPPELKDGDASRYRDAMVRFHAGDWGASRALGKPLFEAYPGVLAVQDLRCQLAMKEQLPWAETKVECAPLMKLSTKK